MTESISNRMWLAIAVLCAVALVWTATPGPGSVFRNADQGSQLAGAAEVAVYGGLPVRTFDHTSGILRFGVSAAAQWLAGHRLIGELLLALATFAVGYAMLYAVAVRAGASPIIALVVLAVQVGLLMPRFHKYYVVLIPGAILLAVQSWLRRPRLAGLAAIALVISGATLYRQDYGAFCFCCASAAVFANPSSRGRRFRDWIWLTALSVVPVAGVWLWLAGPAGIGAYLADLLAVTRTQAGGMSLPHPLFQYRNLGLSVAFAGFYGAAAAWLVASFRGEGVTDLARAWAVFAAVSLVQTAHRADLSHLLQGAPPLVAAAPLLLEISRSNRKGTQAARMALVLILLGTIAAAAGNGVLNHSPFDTVRTYRAGLLAPAQMAARNSDSDWARLAVRLNSCTSSGERIVVWPFSPQVHYFAERPFGSRLPMLGPGFFAAPHQQERVVRALEGAPPLLILWDLDYAYDRRPERRSTATHPLIFEAVQRRYAEIGTIPVQNRRFTVWADLRLPAAAAAAACLLEP